MMGRNGHTMSIKDSENRTPNPSDAVNDDLVSAACIAADAVISSVAGAKLTKKIAQKISESGKTLLDGSLLGRVVGVGSCIGSLIGNDFIPTLAQAIDHAWAKQNSDETAEPEVCEKVTVAEESVEPAVEEVAEEAPAEESAVATMAEVSDEDADDDDAEEEEGDSFAGISMAGLNFIDVKAQPEEDQALLLQEQNGEIQIVTRYRRSFLSRLIQSQGEVQAYYSILKNKLLSYKGIKGRISWGNESFNKGRTYVAKVNAKSRTLYLYLALDPDVVATLEDGKYNFVDVSSKKKYENVPVLMKIKGSRKFKHALELVDLLCRENLQMPDVKNFEEVDYIVPYQSTEELVEAGSIKKLVAGIPVSAPVVTAVTEGTENTETASV